MCRRVGGARFRRRHPLDSPRTNFNSVNSSTTVTLVPNSPAQNLSELPVLVGGWFGFHDGFYRTPPWNAMIWRSRDNDSDPIMDNTCASQILTTIKEHYPKNASYHFHFRHYSSSIDLHSIRYYSTCIFVMFPNWDHCFLGLGVIASNPEHLGLMSMREQSCPFM